MESFDSETLTCEGFENRLHQILDDRLTLTGDARLMSHAAQCRDCETILLEYDSFEDSISFLKQSTVEVTCIVDDDGSDTRLFRPLTGLAFLAAMLLIGFNLMSGLSLDRGSNVAQRGVDEKASPSPSPASIGQLAMTKSSFGISSRSKRRVTPDTSPFSPNFRVADNIPQLPVAPNWETVSKPFETLEPVLNYSAGLPGIKTIQCTLNVTIELLRRSLGAEPNSQPNHLGLDSRLWIMGVA